MKHMERERERARRGGEGAGAIHSGHPLLGGIVEERQLSKYPQVVGREELAGASNKD